MHRVVLAIFLLWFSAQPLSAENINFSRDIKPILSDVCYECHGPDAEHRQGGGEAGLRFDSEEDAFADLGGHFAIVPGDLAASELIRRITSTDQDEVMPPRDHRKSLTPAQKKLLIEWVEQGANWSQHWAYVAPRKQQRLNRDGIDAFVREKLVEQGLKLSPPATKHTLLRRVHFDLIGLPPSVEDVDQFLADNSDQAWEEVVDRLLASPHFGERMAIYWLDLVRYADTVGYHGDQDVSVSPFRDYVIEAFNSNMPFAQFTREQLAGDLLPNATQSQLIASGYNKLGMMSAEGGAQPKEYLTKYASDRVRTASTVWLGATLGCAECHNHKFDPFTQQDFYQFAAFFADIEERGLYSGANRDDNWGPTIKVPDAELNDLLKPIDARIAELTQTMADADLTAAQAAWESQLLSAKNGWQVLEPSELTAEHATALELQADWSVLATGPNVSKNTYTFKTSIEPLTITGFRLEVLPHESLPAQGPGRADNGNFVLSEFRVSLEGDSGEKTPLKLAKALATFEQADTNKKNPYKGWPAAAAIDADVNGDTWGWAILPEIGRTHQFVVELESPLVVDQPKQLLFELQQNHHQSSGHSIGRFRLSLTTKNVRIDPLLVLPANVQQLLQVHAASRTEDQRTQLAAYYRSIAPELTELRRQLETAGKQREVVEQEHTRLTLITKRTEPREMRVLRRGNWMDTSGEVVAPQVPHFLPQIASPSRATRLDLANWLMSRDNPLTARVFVNRLWKMLFGVGLSKILDDIGSQGEFPTHPELLDALAVEFMDSGWDVKHIIKLMVMSQTYRQSSIASKELIDRDPYNRLLARQSRFRLDAELVRDNALAVSGLLVREIGGRSVKPYHPEGLLRHLNFPPRTYKHDSGSNQYRRGVYTHWQRQFLHPALQSFDAPAREECTAERTRSNTPLAALVLLNDPSYIEAARVFAENILTKQATDLQHLTDIFQQALSRYPNSQELTVLTKLLTEQRQRYSKSPDSAHAIIAVGEWPVAQGSDAVELASWLAVTRAVFNLHEFITRN